MSERQVGRHSIGFEPPALLRFVIHGDVLPEDGEAFTEFAREHTSGRPFVLLMADLSQLGGIPVHTRKNARRQAEGIPYRGMAFHGASLSARVFAKLVLGAMRLISGETDNPVRFFDTEAEARAWLTERARALSGAPQRRSAAAGGDR